MEKKTKIVVLRSKELIYTGIFVALGILLLILLLVMFLPKEKEEEKKPAMSQYVAGVYSTSVMLNKTTFDVEVVVNENQIQSIALKNLSESVETMYPLLEPALDKLAEQIYVNQSTENITYDEDNKYTSLVLLNAIESSLQKAAVP